jgi:hypothetical protein
MKIYADVEQGSPEWFKLRLGIPTASCFDQIVTPKKCELSASAYKYALRLCAEKLLNMPSATIDGQEWMERGKELEDDAVRQYEFHIEKKTIKVGFITTDDGSVGFSPDRLVMDGKDRRIALEIKCPSQHVHLGYLLDGAAPEYKPQVQGQIWIADLDRADLYSYHPQMPPALIQTAPDREYIQKLSNAVDTFKDLLARMMERAQSLGVYLALERAASPLEIQYSQQMSRSFREETFAQFAKHGFNA